MPRRDGHDDFGHDGSFGDASAAWLGANAPIPPVFGPVASKIRL
jgi:hypothetical protein